MKKYAINLATVGTSFLKHYTGMNIYVCLV